MNRKPGLRIACVLLPRLPIERWAKSSEFAPEDPVVLTVEGTHGPVIHAVTAAAATRGAQAGARLVDARALDPGIVAIPADPAGDQAAMGTLARWAARWSPLVEVDGESLKLDVTGAAHLFGGERGLIEDINARFAALGLTARVAIAPTAAAAWALAHYQPLSPLREREGLARQSRVGGRGDDDEAPPLPARAARESTLSREGRGDLAAALAPLPVAALRLSPQATRTLERLGLKTIGALAGIERRSLARRFRNADNPVDALDRALGRKADPLTAQPDQRPPRVTLRLAEPVAEPSAGVRALDLLIPGLVRELQQRQIGARRLALTGFRVDGSVALASVETSIPSREPEHLQRLLADKAEALDPGFGFDGFALEASWAEPLSAAQDSLVEEASGEHEVARLVDRLTVKLGRQAVRRPRACESHLPERASGWVGAVSSSLSRSDGEGDRRRRWRGSSQQQQNPSTIRSSADGPPPREISGRNIRPHRLLDRPEAIAVIYATPEGLPRRFIWRRVVHDIARVEGPERIAPEWWRERSTARLRDYYRVEDNQGRRYWIYRQGLIGDGRGGLPEWYLHGLFG